MDDKVFDEMNEQIEVDDEGMIQINKKSYKEKNKKLFYLDPELDKDLDYYKEKTNVSRSRLVEMALEYFFKHLKLK